MAEPVTSASAAAAEAADAAEDETTSQLPKNAEDRKAAEALNSLNANEMSQENGETATRQPSAADQEALGKAMSRLELASGLGRKKTDSKKEELARTETEVKKKVKINSDDVSFLVEELDLSKTKATELLRSHEGDVTLAIKAFIAPTARARAKAKA